MNLIRWNVLPEMSILQRQMNRLFDEATQNWNGDANAPSGWSPETDIYETETDVVLQADLPGFNVKDIDIVVENSVLTIRGERQFEAKVQPEGLHRMERSYGKFSRSFTLPASVNAQKIQANYKNGVLTVTLAKAEHARPKRIQIAATAA
jgi:HSP20 family protein